MRLDTALYALSAVLHTDWQSDMAWSKKYHKRWSFILKCTTETTKTKKRMNKKFYVSYEAARLLKEKGYNKKRDFMTPVYMENGCLYWSNHEDLSDKIPAITKSEAIDWLESKGMRINIIYDWLECRWYFTIINGSPTVKSITELEVSDSGFYKTRLEAEEAAIIKALELL